MNTSAEPAFLDIFEEGFDHAGSAVAEARERMWYAQTPLGPLVLRHQQCWGVLLDDRFRPDGQAYMRRLGITEGPLWDWFTEMIASQSGVDHKRLRGLVSRYFTPRGVETLRPFCEATAERLAAGITRDGGCEFVGSFADRLAGQAICQLLGVPAEDYPRFHVWVRDIGLALNTANEAPRAEAALVGMSSYVSSLIEDRRASPGDDLLSALIAAEQAGRLTARELQNMVLAIFWAGQDSTSLQLGRAMLAFAEHPDQWRLLGQYPELAARAVEEACRLTPQAQLTFRVAGEDVDYEGLKAPAGTLILIGIAAGNRDPRAYVDPGRFDITAERHARQLVFGGGIHACLGMAAGRLEMAVALAELSQRFGPPAVAGEIAWTSRTSFMRGPLSLPLVFGGA